MTTIDNNNDLEEYTSSTSTSTSMIIDGDKSSNTEVKFEVEVVENKVVQTIPKNQQIIRKMMQLVYGLSTLYICVITAILVSGLNYIRDYRPWMDHPDIAGCISSWWWIFREYFAIGQSFIHLALFIARFNENVANFILSLLPTPYPQLIKICNGAIITTILIYLIHFGHSYQCMTLSSGSTATTLYLKIYGIIRSLFLIDMTVVLHWALIIIYRVIQRRFQLDELNLFWNWKCCNISNSTRRSKTS